MRTRKLPGTDLEVSIVCLGTMTWGEQNDETQAHAQLDLALARGVNFIDTAEMYPVPPTPATQGRTEEILGAWIRRHGREGLVLASKVAGPGRRDWIRGGRTDLTRAAIAEAVELTRRRLGVDVIDLYQIHWPQRNFATIAGRPFDPAEENGGPSIREQVEGMAAMIDAGRIRYWGLSNETSWGVCEFRRVAGELSVPPPVTLQNSASLVSRSADGDLAEVLYRESMSLLAYSPLAGGLLTGKYAGGAEPPGARYTLFGGVGARYRAPLVREAVARYLALARESGCTPVELALGWLASRRHLGSIIVGATRLDQLDEDIAAAQVELDASTLARIAEIQQRYPNPAG
ncbi:MAG: aldo/keto reductase [Burkholderiales bacterium]